MSLQILGADGVTVLSTINAGGKGSVLNTQVRSDGSEVNQVFLGKYFLGINIPQFTAALAANTALFAIRNNATRKMKLLLVEAQLAFAGTAAASTAQLSLRKFTNATPTSGTDLTATKVADDSNASASTIVDARCATAGAGLTTTSVQVGNPIMPFSCVRSVTSQMMDFKCDKEIILQANEGILVQYDTVGVIGDALSLMMYWGEYA